MIFKPIDEMSLRHLFSTDYAQSLLGLSYLGPVIDKLGNVQTSPDCMVLDMRRNPFEAKRCEFKFKPSSKKDFSQNGKFDIAIIWDVQNPLSAQQLYSELNQQNGCSELLVLSEEKELHDLPEYTLQSLAGVAQLGDNIVKKLALKRELPFVTVIYMAAKLYPQTFNSDRMIKFLSSKFPSVAQMKPQGRVNVVTAFVQTAPPLLEKLYVKTYRWNDQFNSRSAASELGQLIKANYGGQVPSKQELDQVI